MKPVLVTRPGNHMGMGIFGTDWVADFSEEQRPAFRVKAHCRNCSWEGDARFKVGTVIPQWLMCPKCETDELSAHGAHRGRDEQSREEEDREHRERVQKINKEYDRQFRGSIHDGVSAKDMPRKGRWFR